MSGPSRAISVPLKQVIECGNNNHDEFVRLHSALAWWIGAPALQAQRYGVRYVTQSQPHGSRRLELWRLLDSVWPDWTLEFDWLSELSPWPLILEELKKRAEEET